MAWAATRRRMSCCDRLEVPPDIMFHRPFIKMMATTAQATRISKFIDQTFFQLTVHRAIRVECQSRTRPFACGDWSLTGRARRRVGGQGHGDGAEHHTGNLNCTKRFAKQKITHDGGDGGDHKEQ